MNNDKLAEKVNDLKRDVADLRRELERVAPANGKSIWSKVNSNALPVVSLAISLFALLVGYWQYTVTREELQQTEKLFLEDQRPWLFARGVKIGGKPLADGAMQFQWQMVNSGKSPAIVERWGYMIVLAGPDADKELRVHPESVFARADVVPPGGEVMNVADNRAPNAQQLAEIERGEQFMYFCTEIHYRDTRGRKFVSRNCSYYVPHHAQMYVNRAGNAVE